MRSEKQSNKKIRGESTMKPEPLKYKVKIIKEGCNIIPKDIIYYEEQDIKSAVE